MANTAGNLYAPEILAENGMYLMWYGAQSKNGHDSIHFATSSDGVTWEKFGVVIPTGENNHVNDPSVVKVNGTYFMYYSVAPKAELDQIWCATSPNGLNWTIIGAVLLASEDATQYDSLKVGRPSVLYQNGVFKMWFDGSQRNATDPEKILYGSGRHLGYATSSNGFNWTKWSGNPIVMNSGAIDVEYVDSKYIMVEESGDGVYWRTATNETQWESKNSLLFAKMDTEFDKYGHVTPFILVEDGKWTATYTGPATKSTWDGNRIDVWYPMTNVTLVQNNQIFRPWATSKNGLAWTLNTSTKNQNFTMTYTQGTQIIAQVTDTNNQANHRYMLEQNGATITKVY